MSESDASRRAQAATVLLWLFLLGFILDPGGGIGIKYFMSGVLLVFLLSNPTSTAVPSSFFLVEWPLFFVMPVAFALKGLAAGADLGDAIGAISFSMTWVIYPILARLSGQKTILVFEQVMRVGGALLIGSFVLLAIAIALGHLDWIVAINKFAVDQRLGYFGINPHAPETLGQVPNVYFRWSLLLIPAMLLAFGRYVFRFLFLALAGALTLSTGLIAFSFLGVFVLTTLWLLTLLLRPLSRRVAAGVAICAVTALVLCVGVATPKGQELFTYVASKVTSESPSTLIKLGHTSSILNYLSAESEFLLVGMGAGTDFYSEGIQDRTVNTEVSHLNLIRQFGLPYFLLFTGYVVWLTFGLWQSDTLGQRLAVGIGMLYLAAGTNPLLMSPVFMIPVILGRHYRMAYSKEQRL